MLPYRRFPDFMEREDKNRYASEEVLGLLYREACGRAEAVGGALAGLEAGEAEPTPVVALPPDLPAMWAMCLPPAAAVAAGGGRHAQAQARAAVRALYDMYCGEVHALALRCGAGSEAEVAAGCSRLQRRKTDAGPGASRQVLEEARCGAGLGLASDGSTRPLRRV